MKELEQFGSSLEADAAKENLKEVLFDVATTTLENIAENLPVIGAIFKLGKSIHSIRDFEMMNKVLTFLHELSTMSKKQRENLINKINDDPIYGQRFGAFMLTAIDRHDFKEKSTYLARACKFYERGDINKDSFIRIKSMIETTDLIDLSGWVKKSYNQMSTSITCVPHIAMEKFITIGIVSVKYDFRELLKDRTDRDFQVDQSKVVKRKLTGLGNLLYCLVVNRNLETHEITQWGLND